MNCLIILLTMDLFASKISQSHFIHVINIKVILHIKIIESDWCTQNSDSNLLSSFAQDKALFCPPTKKSAHIMINKGILKAKLVSYSNSQSERIHKSYLNKCLLFFNSFCPQNKNN